jgi:hypothetical protein
MDQSRQFKGLFHASPHRFKFGEVVQPQGDFDGTPLAFAGTEKDAAEYAKGMTESKRTGSGIPTKKKARVYKVVPVDASEIIKAEEGTTVRSKKGFKVVGRARKLES